MKKILKRFAGAALILGLTVNSIGGVALASEPVLDEEEASVNSETIAESYELLEGTTNEAMSNSSEQADNNILNEGGSAALGSAPRYFFEENGIVKEFSDESQLEEAIKEENSIDSPEEDAVNSEQKMAGLKKLETPTAEWVKERKQITFIVDSYGDARRGSVTWTCYPGQIIVSRTEDSTNVYEIKIYKAEGTLENEMIFKMPAVDKSEFFIFNTFLEVYHETGDYYFTVSVKGDGKTSSDSDTFTSDIWHFETTGKRLSAPSKPKSDAIKRCFLLSIPYGTYEYLVNVYFQKTLFDTPIVVGGEYGSRGSEIQIPFNIPDWMIAENNEGYYSVNLVLFSNDPEQVQLSEESEMSDPIFVGENNRAVNDELQRIADSINATSTEEEKYTAIDAVNNIDKRQLREAITTDTNNSGACGLIQQMENTMNIPVTKSISPVEGMGVNSADDIQLIGAGLNAENLNSGVTFNMGKPAQDAVVPGAYHSSIQVDFSLDDASYKGGKLPLPITIVVPVPANIEPSMLRILHYHNTTDEYDEIIFPYVYKEDDKWYARFVVDSFSPFVFGESDGSDIPRGNSSLVVKQKVDVTSMFDIKYQKYGVECTPKGAATVTAKGVLTGKKAGTAKVFGYVKSGKKWIADKEKAKEVTIELPKINSKTVTLKKKSQAFSGKDNLTGSSIVPTSWKSSKPKVASVDEKTGQITAVANGSTKITAFYGEGKNAGKYVFTVKVLIPAISKKQASIQTGGNLKLSLKNNKLPIVWSSSDETVAKVDAGKVTALTAGKTTITAEVDGVGYSAEIEVSKPKLKKEKLSVKAGKTVIVGLKNTKLKNVVWETSNDKVATVDSKGKVTGVSAGTVTIFTKTGMPEGETLSCEITVTAN